MRQWLERVRAAMGPAVVADFVRDEIPGCNHVFGTQFNAAWDSLTALEKWVEKGVAPTAQVAADAAAIAVRFFPHSICR